jgi:SSU ribosomal protein S4P
VNNKKVDIASYLVKSGDIIKPKDDEATQNIVKANLELMKGRNVPAWMQLRVDTLEGQVIQLPAREDISAPAQEQLIVELCSK